MQRAKRIRVFAGEDERYRGRPLFEAIVLAAKDNGLAGATVFKGFMGYAPHADIATAGILLLAENLPVVVDVVDDEERVEGFMSFLKRAVKAGVVIRSDVLAEQVLPGKPNGGDGAITTGQTMELDPVTRARVYLQDSATFEGHLAYRLIASAFEAAGAGTSRYTTGSWASTVPPECSQRGPYASTPTCPWSWRP